MSWSASASLRPDSMPSRSSTSTSLIPPSSVLTSCTSCSRACFSELMRCMRERISPITLSRTEFQSPPIPRWSFSRSVSMAPAPGCTTATSSTIARRTSRTPPSRLCSERGASGSSSGCAGAGAGAEGAAPSRRRSCAVSVLRSASRARSSRSRAWRCMLASTPSNSSETPSAAIVRRPSTRRRRSSVTSHSPASFR